MRLEVLVEGRPYAVVARFHRKYVDANRPEGEPFEDPGARPYYLAYIQHLRYVLGPQEPVLGEHYG